MNPYLKFKKCLRISKHSFDFIDKDVFQLHWKMSIGFVIYSLLFLVAIYSAIYTVANYDGDIAFNALVIFTGLSQARLFSILYSVFFQRSIFPSKQYFHRLQNFLKYLFAWDLRFLAEILEYIAIVYQINSDHGAHHYMLCKKFANYSQLIIITVPAAYFIAVTLVGCVSLYEFVITGILKAPYSLYFPDIYGETSSNAEIPLFVTNIAFIAVCMAIVFSYDSLILMTFCNVLLLSAIIVRELNDFQSILVDENIAEIEIRHRLLKIICMQKKYKEIIEKLDEGFGRASAIQIVTASLFTSVAVFIAVQVIFPDNLLQPIWQGIHH